MTSSIAYAPTPLHQGSISKEDLSWIPSYPGENDFRPERLEYRCQVRSTASGRNRQRAALGIEIANAIGAELDWGLPARGFLSLIAPFILNSTSDTVQLFDDELVAAYSSGKRIKPESIKKKIGRWRDEIVEAQEKSKVALVVYRPGEVLKRDDGAFTTGRATYDGKDLRILVNLTIKALPKLKSDKLSLQPIETRRAVRAAMVKLNYRPARAGRPKRDTTQHDQDVRDFNTIINATARLLKRYSNDHEELERISAKLDWAKAAAFENLGLSSHSKNITGGGEVLEGEPLGRVSTHYPEKRVDTDDSDQAPDAPPCDLIEFEEGKSLDILSGQKGTFIGENTKKEVESESIDNFPGEAVEALGAFIKVGCDQFGVTVLKDREKGRPIPVKYGGRDYQKWSGAEAVNELPSLINWATSRNYSVAVRPVAPNGITFGHVDDKRLGELEDLALMAIETSPGNYQVWFAIETEQTDDPDVKRRLKMGVNSDRGASGAARWPGSRNCKVVRRQPDGTRPLVQIVVLNPGRTVKLEALEAQGLLLALVPEPVLRRRPQVRHFDTNLPLSEYTTAYAPDRSAADMTWVNQNRAAGHSRSEVAAELTRLRTELDGKPLKHRRYVDITMEASDRYLGV